jgi:hypothetical protein
VVAKTNMVGTDTSQATYCEPSHMHATKPSDMCGATESADVRAATKAAHVTTAAESAHVAAAEASAVSATTTACLGRGREQARGQQGRRQNCNHSFHHIAPFTQGIAHAAVWAARHSTVRQLRSKHSAATFD